jgi:hypothetical protein
MTDHNTPRPISRRSALSMLGAGFGMTAFSNLAVLSNMVQTSLAQAVPTGQAMTGALSQLHFKPRAKRVIFILMNGGLSAMDAYDPKPMLDKYHGQPVPPSLNPYKDGRNPGNLLRTPFKFKKYGQSGMDFSELWPLLGQHADEMAMIRSMHSDIPNHEPCLSLISTGSNIIGSRPSMGSWLTYGLGTENSNLPGFVVLLPDLPISGGPQFWSSTFLPAIHQGTLIKNRWIEGQEFDVRKVIPNIANDAVDRAIQRQGTDLLAELNKAHMQRHSSQNSQLDASIKTMETAFRMQTEALDVFDVTKESKAVRDMYGPGSVALGCMMVVRLIEKGVRCVQLYTEKGDPWDAHYDIESFRPLARDADRPYAALLTQLKQRGLWEDTLVIGATEMGRTPSIEIRGSVANGRNHNEKAWSIWLAGAGIKGGTIYGATDDIGFQVTENPVHVHDLHATILYLMGIDHTKLTYHYSGRDFRLTDTEGKVVHDIIS